MRSDAARDRTSRSSWRPIVSAQRRRSASRRDARVPLRQLIMGRYGWWNLWLVAGTVAWHVPAELDSLENARHISAPAVFILADQDDFVGPRYQRMVLEAYAGGTRRVVLHGGHW